MSDTRRVLIERLSQDLIGPMTENETIEDRPTDRYLTGILHPPASRIDPEDDDDASAEVGDESAAATIDTAPAFRSFRPSAAGLSFALQGENARRGRVRIQVSAARYVALEKHSDAEEPGSQEDGEGPSEGRAADGRATDDEARPRRRLNRFKRLPLAASLDLDIEPTPQERVDLSGHGIHGMGLTIKASPWQDRLLVTVAITNDTVVSNSAPRRTREEACFLQTSLQIDAAPGSKLVEKPRSSRRLDDQDDDLAAGELIFRVEREYAVGHTCSAVWDMDGEGLVLCVRTSWMPEAETPAVSPTGHSEFDDLNAEGDDGPLGAEWLAGASDDELADGLTRVIEAYERWTQLRSGDLTSVPKELQRQGELHLERCRLTAKRMRGGLALIGADPVSRRAFRLANRAIALQNSWKPGAKLLRWRPFQLGFALLALKSTADGRDPDRSIMDLLWFPTGGGKTEAYLLLTAFAIFRRRLASPGDPAAAGVTVFMRYTLRLLTIQQFERAAALICACELLRLGLEDGGPQVGRLDMADEATISIGLWVGGAATPNGVEDAAIALSTNDGASPAQVSRCPCCRSELDWALSDSGDRIEAKCPSGDCKLGTLGTALPIWTVDEDVYRERPSLLIGTADKYAQIARNESAGRLFGVGTPAAPPDLIIQDELHLISGPLGTLAGLYEVAVDELCAYAGAKPKIIGSTATIRRARDQIRDLFDRDAFQFPPPGLHHGDSGFAVADHSAPGRIYVGVTTVGRSAKFTLQAVAGSLLQSATASDIAEDARDGYSTLVSYFNSLRELGGALVLMRDDVDRTIDELATRRDEEKRTAGELVELTSRVASVDIPPYLKRLETHHADRDAVDIVLASNMISVGMDVSRLGLMLVNGQPKTMAEYIQATSRVGRNRAAPGLVVTVYNAAKARDRSRYEAFASWHAALYREVEATSVTPFAPRARDRALHAPLVGMARHLLKGMGDPSAASAHEGQIWAMAEKILERIDRIDPEEALAAQRQLENILNLWLSLPEQSEYWNDYGRSALLISAEAAAQRRAKTSRHDLPLSTPNSLRSVEASTKFTLRSRLSVEAGQRSGGER